MVIIRDLSFQSDNGGSSQSENRSGSQSDYETVDDLRNNKA